MSTEVKVPTLGESISEAIVLEWLVSEGDFVEADQDLVVLETDKVTVNVPSPVAGTLEKRVAKAEDEVEVGEVIALIDENGEKTGGGDSKSKSKAKAEAEASESDDEAEDRAEAAEKQAASGDEKASDDKKKAAKKGRKPAEKKASGGGGDDTGGPPMMPAVRRLVAEHDLDPSDIEGSGRGGRILKEDVLRFVAEKDKSESASEAPSKRPPTEVKPPEQTRHEAGPREEVVPMSMLRRRIAERLVAAQQDAAMLTTFNELDMTAVLALRKQYKESFQEKYGIKLGFTAFFAKACIEGLKAFPAVNAEIRGTDIIYKNFFDIGIAVGGGRGLVVPVVRDADHKSFAEFEVKLAELADKARNNRLTLEEMTGGTFTISNGGVYGSMLSTPILNPPQSGILGLHKIEQRPVAVNGEVVIRPMMYVALSYDHRIVDGREAVSFLVKVKECIEDPARMLLEV